MARPDCTYTRTGPPACTSSRPQTLADASTRDGGICPRTIYTTDDADVVDYEGPALKFYRRLNSMYFVLVT